MSVMPEHDFYADPTVFDHWQSNAQSWVSDRVGRLSPYSWFLSFSGLALTFLLVAFSVFLYLLHHGLGGQPSLPWNQALAQGVIVIVSLLASQHLLRQAKLALPHDAILPVRVRGMVDLLVGQRRHEATAIRVKPRASDARSSAIEVSLQEFFAGVRAAGVNVSIARALFNAGIRSPQRLIACEDTLLLTIRGVGPATLRKLRKHFERTG